VYSITKDFAFSASHHLDGLPARHQCARLHGHNYQIRVQLIAALLDDVGFVLDYGELGDFKEWIDKTVDHRDLNDVLRGTIPNPTAEHLSRYLTEVVRRVCQIPDTISVAVGVSETPKTWAWYLP
jgi:6-pyruvoyltetrahydropterin/6-carboxytetrahydropterin synthase